MNLRPTYFSMRVGGTLHRDGNITSFG
jgi:hypothetical protein